MPRLTPTLVQQSVDLLVVAADAASNEEDVPDTFAAEARLAINQILSRTDD
jgi:hypothetical protein